MDGVIIDSEHVHHDLERQLFDRLGIEVSPAEHSSFTGQTVWTMWGALKEKHGLSESVEDLRAAKKALFYEEMDSVGSRVGLVPGVNDLIEGFHRRGLKMAVASSSSTAHVEHMIERFGLSLRFDRLLGGDLVERSKPAPDLFLEAAAQLGADPVNCLVIEDSNNGVKAAKAAGMKVIGYQNPNSGTQDLSEADFIIVSYTDFPYIELGIR